MAHLGHRMTKLGKTTRPLALNTGDRDEGSGTTINNRERLYSKAVSELAAAATATAFAKDVITLAHDAEI